MRTISSLNERLSFYGLRVAYYNPGDNPNYRIVPEGTDYFAGGFATFHTLAEAYAFAIGLEVRDTEYMRSMQRNR